MSNMTTQIKFTIESDIVTAFKSRCLAADISMTSAIRQFMITYRPARGVKPKTLTRPLRKKTVMEIIDLLNNILELEEEYRDNIPEVFTQRYDAADLSCGRLEEAIDCLEDAY